MSTPPGQRKAANSWLVIILVALFMFLLFMGTIVYFIWAYKDKMIATTVNLGIHAVLTETPLPQEQKKLIIEQTDRVYEAFLDNRIVIEDMIVVVEHLLNGPVLPMGAVYFALNHYIEISEMTQTQKAVAQLQVGRMARAGVEEKINTQAIQLIVDIIKTPVDPNNPSKKMTSLIKENLTVQELDQVLELAQQLADGVSIPNEPYTFDPSQHIKKAVDQLLGPTPGTPAPGRFEPENPELKSLTDSDGNL